LLRCTKCNRVYEEDLRIQCECEGTLLVERKYSSFAPQRRYFDMRRYLPYLPVNERFLPYLHPPVTPVSKVKNVIFKLEYLHPTGSFKDRGTYVTVAKLKELKIKEIVIDSSGNAAISMAVYSAFSNIRTHIFVSSNTRKEKLSLLSSFGAELHIVEGDRMKVHEEAVKYSRENNIPYLSHWLNPYFLEGTKTVAYEIYEQVGVPEYVVVPTGSGTLFIGIWKGFKELFEMGEISRLPKMIAVQAKGFESLCKRSNSEANVLADGIAIPNPPRKEEMFRIIKESNGSCISIGERVTRQALTELYRMGFIVEPTSAVAYAALKFFEDEGKSFVVPLTGSGLKLHSSF